MMVLSGSGKDHVGVLRRGGDRGDAIPIAMKMRVDRESDVKERKR